MIISIVILFLVIVFSQINLCQTSSVQESQEKQSRRLERSRPANFNHHFHRWCKQITMWCKSLTLEKYISFRMKWFFRPPFLSVSPFLLLNLARRQSYAYAIGLYTRPEIKSWPDVKFCSHAHCVLPRCLWSVVLSSIQSFADSPLTFAYDFKPIRFHRVEKHKWRQNSEISCLTVVYVCINFRRVPIIWEDTLGSRQ